MDDMLVWILVGIVLFLVLMPFLIGALLSRYQRATRVELVKAPIDQVWEGLTELSRQTEWRTDLKSVQLKDDDDGMRWVEQLKHGGKLTLRKQKEVLRKEIIVQIERGTQVIGTRQAVLNAVPGGTRITFTETAEHHSPLQRLRARLGGGIDLRLQTYIAQFKAHFQNPANT